MTVTEDDMGPDEDKGQSGESVLVIYIIISHNEIESVCQSKNHRFLAQPKRISRCSIDNNIGDIISR